MKHLHGTMLEQTRGQPCIFHKDLGGCCEMEVCDLAVFGTPCNPFSDMRVKRYRDGSVVQHPLADVTFRDARNMLVHGQHKSLVMEQVAGFDKPFKAGDARTPLRQPGAQLWKENKST